MKKVEKLIRYCPPTKLDPAPFGTIYHVIGDEAVAEQEYIQVSDKESYPHWERIGDFLEEVFHESLNDQGFINECLRTYQHMQQSKLSEIE